MNVRTAWHRLALASIVLAALSGPLLAYQESKPAKAQRNESVTLTGEVLAVDQANRTVTMRGPLGGEVIGHVSDQAKNLPQVKIGDMVTIVYFQSLAISAKRPGETVPIFSASDKAAEGERPAGYVATKTTTTVTVVSVDPEARSLVVQDDKGVLTAANVERPEIAEKLKLVKEGDKLEVVRTEAFIVSVSPATGAKPSISHSVSTLVIDKGEVIKRMNNTIWVRNEQGKTVKVVVDPKFKFKKDGKDATVTDLNAGDKLTRTSFRVVESASYEAP